MAPPLSEKESTCRSTITRDNILNNDEVWIFGYGSLIWKTNFPYSRRVAGYVEGYKRRFWQGSTDHRGTPGKPGRVVTLIPDEQEETWGLAFQVHKTDVSEVIAYLNHRERGGYTTKIVTFHPKEKGLISFDVLIYIATPDNEEFLGKAPLDEIAHQIATSHGPSGRNSDYLIHLAEAFRQVCPGVTDHHLFELERRVKDFMVNNRCSKQVTVEA